MLVLAGAAAKSGLATSSEVKAVGSVATPPVGVGAGDSPSSASTTCKLHAAGMVFASEAEAAAALSQAVIRDPALSARLQVVPEFEMAA